MIKDMLPHSAYLDIFLSTTFNFIHVQICFVVEPPPVVRGKHLIKIKT